MGTGIQRQEFLISAFGGSEYSALRSGRFISAERGPGTHWIECAIGPQTRSLR
jgi:hypothetical protein